MAVPTKPECLRQRGGSQLIPSHPISSHLIPSHFPLAGEGLVNIQVSFNSADLPKHLPGVQSYGAMLGEHAPVCVTGVQQQKHEYCCVSEGFPPAWAVRADECSWMQEDPFPFDDDLPPSAEAHDWARKCSSCTVTSPPVQCWFLIEFCPLTDDCAYTFGCVSRKP